MKKQDCSLYIYIFLLCFIPGVIYLSQTGFYWDDWSQLFLHVKFGDSFFWDYYAYNRPLSAWTDIIFFPICGTSPVRWHLLLFLLKFIFCVLFYEILKKLPGLNRKTAKLSAILLSICPLFSQWYISIAYTQHLTDYILYACSILFLIKSSETEKKPSKWLFFLFSLVCEAAHLTITEYFAFLELLKIPLLYFIFRKKEKDSHKNTVISTIRSCLPHLIVFLLYCFYRLNISRFFEQFSAETPDLLYLFLESPVAAIRSFFKNLAVDMLYPFTGFISNLFDFNLPSILSKSEIIPVLASAILAAGLLLLPSVNKQDSSSGQHKKIILICIVGLFLSVLPFLVMNENYLNTDDPAHADRTFLAAAPFVCVIFSEIITVLFPSKTTLRAAGIIAVFLFAHTQIIAFRDAALFKNKQNSFYQQLSIRAPGITDGTAIVDDTIIFTDQGNFSTASALNVLYPNSIRENGDVPLWVFSYPERLRENHGGFHVQNRVYHMNQPPTDYIYVDYDNQYANCLWVFSPEDTDNPHITDLQRGWIAGTNIVRIDTEASISINQEIFGAPISGWCSYYQQAALLRQKEEWYELLSLTETILAEGYHPSDSRSNSPFEWWPFIEALTRTGREDDAQILIDEAVSVDSAYREFFRHRMADLKEML